MDASVWLWTVASVAAISLVSFIGVITLVVDRKRVQPVVFAVVGLAVGAMLGDTFIHILPEAFETAESPMTVSLYCLAGIVIFFILEKFLLWRHDHAAEHTHPIHPVGYINLVADGIHNFIDGVLVGAAYLVSVPIGVATTVAVCLHEIPQEIGDFGVLMHAGFSRAKALWFNFFTATLAVAGAVVALVLGSSLMRFTEIILPMTAGGFIYIAGSDLVPELHKEREPRQAAVQLLAIAAGIGAMLLLTRLE